MSDPVLREKGRAVRRQLVGDICADKLDREVYTDPHMEKFGEITQEVLFAQLWTRPGLDLKTKSMVTLITDVSTGSFEAMSLHVRFCRIHGWTEDEVVEAMLHCIGYLGVPLVRKSILVARDVFREMHQNGELADGQ
ncbi:carboxymuconolactone decarboxylase family protein [Gemmobacter sp.]|uniref:carboxymuconolactone decarboxylase family protein n=1 Tax=Gemmobacter sp. TaxID=1898957 RepID=UPI002AFFDDAA|nr:carboxymuconolactone decarboxylase family protein [Gemmobacter sp.]